MRLFQTGSLLMSSRNRKILSRAVLSEYRHAWYLLIWVGYLALFYLAEQIVTTDYYVSWLPLDDKIPFCRYFIIPYCMWHPLLVLMTAYLFFFDVPAFKRFMRAIALGFFPTLLFCLLVPNGQELRPAEFAQEDIFTWLVRCIYAADTNTNVIPSMHVLGCAALSLACADCQRLRARRLHFVMLPLGVLISISTVFVKQHSVLDVLTALPLCALMWLLIYRPHRKKPQDKAE